MNDFLNAWSPRILSVLRIITGFLFLWHGSQKLFGFPPSPQGGGSPTGIILVAGILEFFGGLLILLGLFTRWTAFVLCGLMAVAYWMQHFPKSPWPLANMGEGAILFCFVFLYIAAAGPGAWGVDSARMRGERIR